MNTIQAILIAIIEGITEFLPISSTAHMKFANPFLGIDDSPFVDLFEIVIQLAAIATVVVIYYKQFFDFKNISFYLKLMVAVIPALIFGALLKKKNTRISDIKAMRGNIYADGERLLATTTSKYTLIIDAVADGLTDELFDKNIKTTKDIENILNLRILGSITEYDMEEEE